MRYKVSGGRGEGAGGIWGQGGRQRTHLLDKLTQPGGGGIVEGGQRTVGSGARGVCKMRKGYGTCMVLLKSSA